MASIALERTDVIVGVDTHKDQHVAVAIDGHGGRLGELFVDATNEGYAQLLSWASSLGRIHGFGVEGCGSYGVRTPSTWGAPTASATSLKRPTCSASGSA